MSLTVNQSCGAPVTFNKVVLFAEPRHLSPASHSCSPRAHHPPRQPAADSPCASYSWTWSRQQFCYKAFLLQNVIRKKKQSSVCRSVLSRHCTAALFKTLTPAKRKENDVMRVQRKVKVFGPHSRTIEELLILGGEFSVGSSLRAQTAPFTCQFNVLFLEKYRI